MSSNDSSKKTEKLILELTDSEAILLSGLALIGTKVIVGQEYFELMHKLLLLNRLSNGPYRTLREKMLKLSLESMENVNKQE